MKMEGSLKPRLLWKVKQALLTEDLKIYNVSLTGAPGRAGSNSGPSTQMCWPQKESKELSLLYNFI